MTIEAQFDRIATALEGIGQRIDTLGAAIAALGAVPARAPFIDDAPAITVEVNAAPATQDAPEPAPKKRGRPALKVVEDAAPAPATEPESPAPTPGAAALVQDTPAPTEEDVKTGILELAKNLGKAAALAILERHGATRVRDLNPDFYGAVLADIEDAQP